MKRDPYFKYVAAALIAGVLLAFTGSSSAAKTKPVHATTLVHAAAISAKS